MSRELKWAHFEKTPVREYWKLCIDYFYQECLEEVEKLRGKNSSVQTVFEFSTPEDAFIWLENSFIDHLEKAECPIIAGKIEKIDYKEGLQCYTVIAVGANEKLILVLSLCKENTHEEKFVVHE
jgi:hypothetical protein